MSKPVIISGEYIMYALAAILVLAYLIWKNDATRGFIQKYALFFDILMISVSIGVIISMFYLFG
jgi:hypothetical protein